MRRPALTLRPVTPDDLPPLAPVHRLAFWPTKVNLYSYSDVTAEAYEAHFINRFGKFIKQRDEDGVRYLISVATRGDKYLGYGFSSFEVDEKDRPADSGEKRFWPEGANVRRAEEYLAGTLDKHKKDNLPFAHWCTSLSFPLPLLYRGKAHAVDARASSRAAPSRCGESFSRSSS